MAGRRRMRVRQPDVHGGNAGLGAKTGNGQNEKQRDDARARIGKAWRKGSRVQGGYSGRLPEADKKGQQKNSAQVRGNQVCPGSVAHRAVPVIEINQEERRKGHDFPGQQKQYGIGRAGDKGHAEQQEKIKKPVRRDIVLACPFVPERD